MIEALKRRDGWNPGGVGGSSGKTAENFRGRTVRHSSRWLFSYMLNGGIPSHLPDARDSSFVSFCIPRCPLFVTISQRRAVRSLFFLPVSLSLSHPLLLRHPSGHCGSHLAALFYVSIVTGPSLSPVDVTRSTGTRSRSPLMSEAETLGARLLVFHVALAKKEKKKQGKVHENYGEVKLNVEYTIDANWNVRWIIEWYYWSY